MKTDAPLNQRQTRFAQLVAQGKTQADAYREAYPHSSAWKDISVKPKASRLAADPRVAALVAKLQAEGAQAAVYTLADHLQRLDALSKKAEAAQEWNAAITAEKQRGLAAGFYMPKSPMEPPLAPAAVDVALNPGGGARVTFYIPTNGRDTGGE